MQSRSEGLTLWYGDDRTAAPSGQVLTGPPVSVTVGVRPAALTNSIEVEYRVNDGPTRILRSSLLEDDAAQGVQFFRALFPYLPPGSKVEYASILRSLGRRIDPRLGSQSPSSFAVLQAKQSPSEVQVEIPPGRGVSTVTPT